MDDGARPVEEPDVRRPVGRPHIRIGRQGRQRVRPEGRDGPDDERQRDQGGERRPDDEAAAAPQGSTSRGSFGRSPNISGAYIASTRVGGRWRRPVWLRRIVYSTEKAPFGT